MLKLLVTKGTLIPEDPSDHTIQVYLGSECSGALVNGNYTNGDSLSFSDITNSDMDADGTEFIISARQTDASNNPGVCSDITFTLDDRTDDLVLSSTADRTGTVSAYFLILQIMKLVQRSICTQIYLIATMALMQSDLV